MKTKNMLLKSAVLFSAALALAACGSTKEETTMSSSSEMKTEMSSSEMSSSSEMMAALKDGTYTAESGFDERGYKVVHSITVKDGKITESTFGYEKEDGTMKADDEEYNAKMKEKSGVSSKEATEKLNAELVEKQSVADVEVVSGATHTSENFKVSAEALIAAAEKGDTAKIELNLK